MSRYERRLAVDRYIRCGGYAPENAYERRLRIENQIATTPVVYGETMEEYQWRIAREICIKEHPEIEKTEEVEKERKLVRK